MNSPKLIDSQIGNYLVNTLKSCHEKRVDTYSNVFNFTILFFFVAIAGIILYICFTHKKTPLELKERMEKEKKFIWEKIHSLQEQKQYYLQEASMTKLPISGLQ